MDESFAAADVSERFPATACATEPPRSPYAAAFLATYDRQPRVSPGLGPRPEQVEVRPRMALANLVFPLLAVQIDRTRRGHLRVELGRRNLLGVDPPDGGRFALCQAQRVVHDRGRVDLHRDRVGIGRVEVLE